MMKYVLNAAFLLVIALISLADVPVRAEEKRDVFAEAHEKIREGKNKEALDLLKPYISDPGKYPVAVSDYIVVLVWEGRFDEAVNLHEKLPAAFVRKPYVSRNVAKAYYEKKEFSKALALYSGLLEQTPSDEEAQKGVIYCLIQTDDLTAASSNLERFLKASPGSFQLSVLKAELLVRQDKYIEALQLYRLLELRHNADRESVYRSRENMLAGVPEGKRQALLAELSQSVQTGEEGAVKDLILTLILVGDYKEAVYVFEKAGMNLDQYSLYMRAWSAWAYFKAGDIANAKSLYKKVLDDSPGYARARIGMAYCLAKEGDSGSALRLLDEMLSEDPQNTEIMFGRAYVFETSKRPWLAIQEYERIHEISKINTVAQKQRLLDFSDLGISSYGINEMYLQFPHESKLIGSIQNDMAVDRINWNEFEAGIKMLRGQIKDESNLRAQYDYIVALVSNNDMKEAVVNYELLMSRGIDPPEWVMENAAVAYLYLEQPYKALDLYERVLLKNPNSYNSRLGRFYTLQELRRWDEAGESLDALDKDVPQFLERGKKPRPNWPKTDIALARGWFYAYEERLEEAEKYFFSLHEKAPANTNFRTGLAHVYLWRGHPRKALTEFSIAGLLSPDDVNGRTGYITALNTLANRKQAREEAAKLLSEHPKNRNVRDLVRQLSLEEKKEASAGFMISAEDDDVEAIMAETRLAVPVTLYTDIYGFLLWNRTRGDEQESSFKRTGIGLNHVFSSEFRLEQRFSINYDDGKDAGSFTEIGYTPDDYWTLALLYDSFTTDVPMRARVRGIEADKFNASLTYRENESGRYSLSHTHQKFSDDNKRDQEAFSYERGLYTMDDWKMRLFLNLYMSSNSRDDAPYFNPDHDFSISVTHMTEQTLMRLYRQAFLHRIFLTLGIYDQADFPRRGVGSVRYEHDINFSDTHSLLYGASLGRQAFDGEAVTGRSFYLTWRMLF